MTVELPGAVIVPRRNINNEGSLNPIGEDPLNPAVQVAYIVSGAQRELFNLANKNSLLGHEHPDDEGPHLTAVVCHGGHNTVCESLAHGVPLVVAPIKHDQPIVAEQVARAGAGIRVSFHRARPESLREALLSVIDDPSYRAAAERVRASFAAAGGATAAASRLAALA